MIQKIDDGYITNINKPEDWTSFDVVKKIRGITRIKKVGHAGTLDPFATGVLLICLGKGTKKVPELMNLRKEYEGVLTLGQTTDTLDPTGKIVAEKPVPALHEQQILTVFKQLTGSIQQKIPAFSAAKFSGKRSYALARKGFAIPDRYKTVEIYDIRLLNYLPERIHFCVECGQGTYIRSLGYDIAHKLGTTGYLVKLIRNRIGKYCIEQSLTLDEFEQQWKKETRYENN